MAGEGVVGDDADQGALERADVVGDPLGDQFEDRRIGELDVVERGALAQDRDAGREVGRRMSATRPDSKRSRRRSSTAERAAGGGGRR